LCDRQLVEGCIIAWFGSIQNFNETVQSSLFDIFRVQLGTFAFPYTSFLMAGTPVLWAFVDLAGVYWGSGDIVVAFGTVGLGIACWVCLFPCVFALISTLASTAFLQRPRGKFMRFIIAAVVGGICDMCIIVSGGASFLSLQYLGSIVGPIVYLVLTGIIAAVVFIYGSHKHAPGVAFPSKVMMNMRGQSCESLTAPEPKSDSPLPPIIDSKMDQISEAPEQNGKVQDETGGEGVLELPAPTEKFPEVPSPAQKIVGVGLQKVVVEWC